MGFATSVSIARQQPEIKESTKKVPNWKMKALYPNEAPRMRVKIQKDFFCFDFVFKNSRITLYVSSGVKRFSMGCSASESSR